jgi:hypothetical protein
MTTKTDIILHQASDYRFILEGATTKGKAAAKKANKAMPAGIFHHRLPELKSLWTGAGLVVRNADRNDAPNFF